MFKAPTLLALSLAAAAPALQGQMTTITYTLEDVWLLPDVSHPTWGAQQMTGTFQWTYDTSGDFADGTGAFLDYYIPWATTNFGPLEITMETKSFEFVLPGDWHDFGVDLTLRMLPELSPDQAVSIDPILSTFDIESGISKQGHVISGEVVPGCPALAASAVPRPGTPPNPPALLVGPSNGPVVGVTWDPVIDHTSFVLDAVTDFVIVSGGPANVPLGPAGTLLCNPAAAPFALLSAPSPGAPFSVPVPDNCGLVGVALSAQGGSIDPGFQAHLTNALDITIGAL